jgi:hypothetical protein
MMFFVVDIVSYKTKRKDWAPFEMLWPTRYT